MKKVDVIAAILLVIGGLNWGLVGLMNFDLVAKLLGEMSVLSRAVYCLVGLAALYQAASWKAIQKRWNAHPALATH
ncbi:MAG TPA: DUF378 domain-containing protein [Terriglobales bacterium]|nr:DUF378 domain-containing protein [Terriglobales bacterium]